MAGVMIQTVTAFTGSLGFAMLFGLRRCYWISASVGGGMGWMLYLLGIRISKNIFVASVSASAVIALYAEWLARQKKAPATVFFIPSIIPLIPGSTLYYAMNGIVCGNFILAKECGIQTLQFVFAIATGTCLVWAGIAVWTGIKRKRTI